MNQARVVELIVESSVFFDCTVNLGILLKQVNCRECWMKLIDIYGLRKQGASKNTDGNRKSEYVWN